jgi:hypothetical protein
MKTVNFNIRKIAATPDEWVNLPAGAEPKAAPAADPKAPEGEPMRFSMLMPRELHRRVKTQCAQRGLIIADVIREFLEREFPST